MLRFLVGIGYAREVRDLTAQRLGIQPLDIPAHELRDGAAHVDLNEVANQPPRLVTRAAIGRDGGGDRHARCG